MRAAISASAAGCSVAQLPWQPREDVLEPTVSVSAIGGSLGIRLRAGEDARAVVCVTPRASGRGVLAWLARVPGRRCQATSLIGLRPADITMSAPTDTRNGVDVTVDLAAESNPSRRTLLRHPTPG
ncbi:hypothetical protein BH09ACT13_BH09ACT13_04440 [soil metagenome]